MLARFLPFRLTRRTTFIFIILIFAAYNLISYGIFFDEPVSEEMTTNYPFYTAVLRRNLQKYSILDQLWNDDPPEADGDIKAKKCSKITGFKSEIDLDNIYPSLEFDIDFKAHKTGYWSPQRELNYQTVKNQTTPGASLNATAPSLKVIVMPHSHVDPGWLKTFQGYFEQDVFQILDNLVTEFPAKESMRFIWSEISFLDKWWNMTEPSKRTIFKNLVSSGRIEITTGGWVMTDEATVSLYPMIDQLIEGHQWVQANLGIVPNTSWSVDPFGHGSTFPYLLHSSSINYMTIQRFHYAWKKWFGDKRRGDFSWTPRWDSKGENSVNCHSAPWDIYTIEYSCGPTTNVCRSFDFFDKRNPKVVPENLKERAETLLEQYRKTGSLFPHNVALIPFGDDFRFSIPDEWTEQYGNLMKLFDYINANKRVYNAEVGFGTLSDYFKAVQERKYKFPSLTGDFFVYTDIFTNDKPGHWSGYYGTRPYWKKFYRETENVVRGAEILFTVANSVTNGDGREMVKKMYDQLVSARRDLALFAHHDATTGTSIPSVMTDYGNRLTETWKKAVAIQMTAITPLLFGNIGVSPFNKTIVKENFETPLRSVPLKSFPSKIVLYNSLGHKRSHLTKIRVTNVDVQVVGPFGELVVAQISPVITERKGKRKGFSKSLFELAWIADLEPLSVSVYEIRPTFANSTMTTLRSVVFCHACKNLPLEFQLREMPPWDIRLSNKQIKVTFDRDTGHVMRLRRLYEGVEDDEGDDIKVELNFGGYYVAGGENGAYLLKLETTPGMGIKVPFEDEQSLLFVIDGVLFSEVNFAQKPIHVVTRLMHSGGKKMEESLFVESHVDVSDTDFRGDIFMRFKTDIKNTVKVDRENVPTFFTDSNGFTFEQRTKHPKLNYEENVYPVNSMTYIQDNMRRLTLIVDRSQGCLSAEVGRLECLIERRTERDDNRGIGQGVLDSKPVLSKYVLSIEDLENNYKNYQTKLPTLQARRTSLELSYPPSMFSFAPEKVSESVVMLLSDELPCDMHLINLRTLTNKTIEFGKDEPSQSALLIAHRLGFRCTEEEEKDLDCRLREDNKMFHTSTKFNQINVASIEATGLTGVSKLPNQKNISMLHDIEGISFEIVSAIVNIER